MNDNYEAVIGLEIHAELNTKTKMFCRCLNDPFHSEANRNICPVCLGLPGALPVMNKRAVESTIMVGRALNCQIATSTKWDRKNYFYPDLPKGYQISQYDLPLCFEGKLGDVRITRIHLEEDTGTLQHPTGADYSLVNYNRSGVPLLELVTEPDIHSGKDARHFAEEYQRILRSLGVANADMEKGEMRVEANISVRKSEQSKTGQYGTKVEVKNLNSFRSAEKAINYEIDRQIGLLEKGEPVVQETRGWHDTQQITFTQRVKEGAADYRYFPEPDLPPLELSATEIDAMVKAMPALPGHQRDELVGLGLPVADAEVLVNNRVLADYFAAVQAVDRHLPAKLVANYVINEAVNQSISPEKLADLLVLLNKGEISSKIAKDVLVEMKSSGQSAAMIIESKSLKQLSDSGSIEAMIDQVLAENPAEVAKFKAGKEQVYGFLVGQVMHAAKGQANPQVLNEILRRKLSD